MQKKEKNYAFIDGQNLYLGVGKLGWKIDYIRFRRYLSEKYHISKAYIFIGFLSENQTLYTFLQQAGYILIFKPILETKNGIIKGNCDTELVLQAMIDFNSYSKALIVSGDGDFYCLANYLKSQNKLLRILAPNYSSCSSLLFKIVGRDICFVNDLRKKVEYKKKRTPQG